MAERGGQVKGQSWAHRDTAVQEIGGQGKWQGRRDKRSEQGDHNNGRAAWMREKSRSRWNRAGGRTEGKSRLCRMRYRTRPGREGRFFDDNVVISLLLFSFRFAFHSWSGWLRSHLYSIDS